MCASCRTCLAQCTVRCREHPLNGVCGVADFQSTVHGDAIDDLAWLRKEQASWCVSNSNILTIAYAVARRLDLQTGMRISVVVLATRTVEQCLAIAISLCHTRPVALEQVTQLGGLIVRLNGVLCGC